MSTPALDARIETIAATAKAWRDPEHPPRAEAVAETLTANPLYTSENVAFAVNQAMHAASPTALRRWIGGREFGSVAVGVWVGDPEPLAGWRDTLAVALAGLPSVVRIPETSPYLLAAFVQDAARRMPERTVAFDEDRLPEGLDVILGTGDDEEMVALASWCDAQGIPVTSRLLRGSALVMGVLDGRESADERIGFAEDVLLYAEARRRLRVLWAPEDHPPDLLLDAFTGFRELFPAPPALDGRLQIPRAFLKASGAPHAWGEGYLVSRGTPEPQTPGHLRWTSYGDQETVGEGLAAAAPDFVVAAPRVRQRLAWDGPTVVPGDAHRPRLNTAEPFDLLGRA